MEETLAEALTATPSLPALLWRQGELVMAHRGPNRWRESKKSRSSTAGWPSTPAPFLGGGSQHLGSHSPSRTMRGDSPLSRGCTNMPLHNPAGKAIGHLHPELLPHQATSLGNQVVCMIAEYHLTASTRQSNLRPILPPEVAPLLPAIKNYVPGVSFEGTRDVRVMDHAVALRVAIWLHWLDMAAGGEVLTSESLEAGQHHLGRYWSPP